MIDDLFVSLRVLRHFYDSTNPDHDQTFSTKLAATERAVVDHAAKILSREIDSGFESAGQSPNRQDFPVARQDHFAFGIVDTLQEYASPLEESGLLWQVLDLSFSTCQRSPYAFLRCKAFEVIAQLSLKDVIGRKVMGNVNVLLDEDVWPSQVRQMVREQWEVMGLRPVAFHQFISRFQGHNVWRAVRNNAETVTPIVDTRS